MLGAGVARAVVIVMTEVPTIVLGGNTAHPLGFLGSVLIPPWLILVGVWLFWKGKAAVPTDPVGGFADEVAASAS